MQRARLIVIVVGILLPYLARIPGAFIKGKSWFTSYFDGGIGGTAFICVLQALCWGSILLASLKYQHPSTIWFPAVFGFVGVAIAHACLNLSSSSTAAIGLVAIPLLSVPLVLIGWLVGLWFER
jgi:ACR3 family arsenite efflux pump ArsB